MEEILHHLGWLKPIQIMGLTVYCISTGARFLPSAVLWPQWYLWHFCCWARSVGQPDVAKSGCSSFLDWTHVFHVVLCRLINYPVIVGCLLLVVGCCCGCWLVVVCCWLLLFAVCCLSFVVCCCCCCCCCCCWCRCCCRFIELVSCWPFRTFSFCFWNISIHLYLWVFVFSLHIFCFNVIFIH